MIFPALIYASINPSPPASLGRAVPMATDIAIGVIRLGMAIVPKFTKIYEAQLDISSVYEKGTTVSINF